MPSSMGFLDKTIAAASPVRSCRADHARAAYKMVDTCAAEFDAETPYFYSTYDEENEAAQYIAARNTGKKTVIVFGSGPIRIGQGIEFDYCSVHCVWALKELGYEAIIANNNPETVSTDFDTADRLYFDPLTPEDVDNVLDTEQPDGVVVQFGGQTAIKLTKHLEEKGVNILGTPRGQHRRGGGPGAVRRAAGAAAASPVPQGHTVFTTEEALAAANRLGYPVLLRPSYVLGGQNMIIAYSDADVTRIYGASSLSHEHREPGAHRQVSDGQGGGGGRHLRRRGLPDPRHHGAHRAGGRPFRRLHLGLSRPDPVRSRSRRPSSTTPAGWPGRSKVVGLVNIQYVVYNDEVYVIEVNPRSSRTVPYISKVTGVPDGGSGHPAACWATSCGSWATAPASIPSGDVCGGQGAGVLL